ncbi:NAD(P)-dependent oxidoreductase [Marinococcus halophilus]|uniref:Short-chain dehydrogenase n=1 Tax=Marinococcus halophilus TaxID=1371 RepID=A0A510Y4B1_MARHA|nr:SDR family oxidoreductase [Marinococcus halophilus]OZT80115.1 NAD(P)-dependent oxidoreductase [Marinococcus halophilus]GEK58162.1 short-chain dehydrogenase [Marinococcus halophilus]
MELFNNTGKVALITGGGSGIGKTAAEALSESGATVALVGRTLQKVEDAAADIQQKTGGTVKGYQGDVTKTEDLQRFVRAVYDDLGSIDILVNNAGTLAPGTIDSLSEEEWDQVMDTNAKSIFFTTQAVVPYMKEQDYGRVINTASVAGDISLSFSSVYGTSKAAAIHQTKQLSLELAPYNITVNAISPWFFQTDMNESELADDSFRSAVENRTPMKRLGQLEELKTSYLFFASAGSSYVSGQNVFVDGALTVYGL